MRNTVVFSMGDKIDYSYTKDGKEIKGSQYKFKMEFPKRNKKIGCILARICI